jgi:hypothetical protein
MLDVGQLLEIVAGFGWYYTLTRRPDGSFLCVINRVRGTGEHQDRYKGEDADPKTAVWLALHHAVGASSSRG